MTFLHDAPGQVSKCTKLYFMILKNPNSLEWM